jgi:hypothetical protein
MDDLSRLEEIATIGQKMIGWGNSENGPLVLIFRGDERVHKSNPITMHGAKKEYERLLIIILEEDAKGK